jgi:hypothetical protein
VANSAVVALYTNIVVAHRRRTTEIRETETVVEVPHERGSEISPIIIEMVSDPGRSLRPGAGVVRSWKAKKKYCYSRESN